jgi:hypothetical protein
MVHPAETRPQGWRALAVFDDRHDRLIYLGRSATQVRAGFPPAFFEILDAEERDHVRAISLERWHGEPDAGGWVRQTTLPVPTSADLARSA